MNRTLFMAMLKIHGKKLLNYSLGIILYEGLLTSVYPTISQSSAAIEIAESIPSPVKTIFGVPKDKGLNSFEAYISGQFFGRIWPLIMSIYSVNMSNALIAKLVDEGFLSYPLSTPVSRKDILNTQVSLLLTGIGSLTGITILGLFLDKKIFKIQINSWRYIRFSVLGFAFYSAISAYCILFSALFNEEEQALIYGAGLTFTFYVLDLITHLNDNLSWLKYTTLFSLYKPQEILEGTISPTREILGLLSTAAAIFTLAGYIFQQKDIPV